MLIYSLLIWYRNIALFVFNLHSSSPQEPNFALWTEQNTKERVSLIQGTAMLMEVEVSEAETQKSPAKVEKVRNRDTWEQNEAKEWRPQNSALWKPGRFRQQSMSQMS